jgi:hypothetical protein
VRPQRGRHLGGSPTRERQGRGARPTASAAALACKACGLPAHGVMHARGSVAAAQASEDEPGPTVCAGGARRWNVPLLRPPGPTCMRAAASTPRLLERLLVRIPKPGAEALILLRA